MLFISALDRSQTTVIASMHCLEAGDSPSGRVSSTSVNRPADKMLYPWPSGKGWQGREYSVMILIMTSFSFRNLVPLAFGDNMKEKKNPGQEIERWFMSQKFKL